MAIAVRRVARRWVFPAAVIVGVAGLVLWIGWPRDLGTAGQAANHHNNDAGNAVVQTHLRTLASDPAFALVPPGFRPVDRHQQPACFVNGGDIREPVVWTDFERVAGAELPGDPGIWLDQHLGILGWRPAQPGTLVGERAWVRNFPGWTAQLSFTPNLGAVAELTGAVQSAHACA